MMPKIKVCGLTDLKNIDDVLSLQPDFVGFVFWKKSKRQMTLSSLEINNPKVKKVGVFVDETEEFILEKLRAFHLDYVQLHGDETAGFCKNLKAKNYKIIKAFSLHDTFDFETLKAYENHVDYFLFDTKGVFPGGNGLTFNWQILKNYTLSKAYFLSGGIGLNHISGIKAFFKTTAAKHCEAIDVNSQFETVAGIKNTNLLKQLKHELQS